ncbi:hypothetical protein [Flagellimonas sp. S3867]|uniref:DUF6973 domain-containing protein n=1 Tax=Flagellimonas sp. S3867 TaxID=2768063 RepID=UPI001687C58D|nr:hypothetical protein [Flagellimonas sp. S3867]
MTNVLKTLNRVSLKSFWALIKLCLRFPLFVFPTLFATKECMSTSTELYSRLHYKNGPANAFRHAFWNYLIAKRCFSWQKKVDGVLIWTKKITDWHENAFPNRKLAKKMDLHNNEIGRTIFKEHLSKMENQVVDILREMTSKAIKIDTQTDFTLVKNQLVYIIDDE